eukprot:TRINITY_DN74704_c0_g1_i1.p1 TRINITY_DN74704_c0_g1~~TRINITY_DN74704_c0_g1_i1.p1  ORF type:complete len:591 (+),score=78.70 TRINITY_DN74704_c0_g1_i1:78-1850(+)
MTTSVGSKQPVFSGAFLACILVMFSDILGTMFVEPVSVPYGQSLGASLEIIGAFNTVRFGCNFLSMLWMPVCADKFGKRLLLLISILGSASGYLLQGLAGIIGSPGPTQIGLMFAGRGLAGFFSGTKPVLENAVTLISMPDHELVRTRLTILSSAEMSFGVALAPVAGALAQLTLNLPWLVSSGTAVLIFIITLCIFREPQQVKQADDEPGDAKAVAVGNPMADKYLLTLTFSMLCFGTCVAGDVLVLPMLLALSPFGFVDADVLQTRKNVANATGIAGIPMGVAQLLFSTWIYLALSRRIGEVKTLSLAGVAMVASYILHGFTTSFWQVVLCQTLMGCALGLLLPCLVPVIARWAMHKYPSKGAQASAVPFMGFIFGMMIGPLLMSQLIGDGSRARLVITYSACAGCSAVGTMFAAMATLLILRAVGAHKKDDCLSPEMLKMALESGAVPPEQWIDQMCNSLRGYLTKGSGPNYRGVSAWHGWDQKYWARRLDRAFPQLPDLPAEKEMDFESDELSNYLSAVFSLWWPTMTQQEQEEARNLVGQAVPRCRLPGEDSAGMVALPTVSSRLAPRPHASLTVESTPVSVMSI